jgi:hypothetical protein
VHELLPLHLGREIGNPSSILKIVVTMKKIRRRNMMSAIDPVGIVFCTPCFFTIFKA